MWSNTLIPCPLNNNYHIFRNFWIFQITKKIVKGKYWIYKNILFVEMIISKLTSYLRNVCQSYQGTIIYIHCFEATKKISIFFFHVTNNCRCWSITQAHFFYGSFMNIFNFDRYHSNFLLEPHGVSPILTKCWWFELWTCHNGQPIGHFGVSFVFTLISLLAKLFGFYFMFFIFSCFLASVQPHLRILFIFLGFCLHLIVVKWAPFAFHSCFFSFSCKWCAYLWL